MRAPHFPDEPCPPGASDETMTFPINYLAPDFAVAAQLGPEQIRELAASGFRSFVNNRLEHEAGQPPEEAIRAAAAEANVEYVRLPVDPARITIEDVARFAA